MATGDVWRDRNPRGTAATVQRLREQGRLGEVLAVAPPKLRKAIHDADRLNGKGGER